VIRSAPSPPKSVSAAALPVIVSSPALPNAVTDAPAATAFNTSLKLVGLNASISEKLPAALAEPPGVARKL